MAIAAGDLAAGAVAGVVGRPAGNAGVRLAVAVLLFWLAGLCMFIAFGAGVNDFAQTWNQGEGLKTFRGGLQKMAKDASNTTSGATSG